MTRQLRSHRLSALLASCLLVLAACGGGGGGGAPTAAPDPGPVVIAPPAPAPAPGPAPAPPPAPSLPTVDISPVAVTHTSSPLPDGWQHGAFMQVFVRSYQDSNGDGIGDLQGLIQRLDYLQDLGIKGLWLMPVTASQDADHGYAVTDYRNVETAYGRLADLDALIAAAHARGIGVVMDYVMNHSAALHPLFVNARAAGTNAYRDWYVWQASMPGGWNIYGGNPWRSSATGAYFAPFWDQMPDFNLANAAVVEFHENNLRFWLNRGIDGFRFDAVGNLFENGPAAWENQPANYTLMARLRRLMDGYSRRLLVCEAPADPRGFGAACGSAFAFDLRSQIVNAARGDATAIASLVAYFRNATPAMAPFASNHDSFAGDRLWNQLGGNLAQMKLAAAAYLLLPGTPFIYYGEEIGMASAASLGGDPRLRTPMSWAADTTRAGFTTATPYRALSANVGTNNVAAQATDGNSLLQHYKALIAVRNARPSVARGSYDASFAIGPIAGYQRVLGSERTLVVINFANGPTGSFAIDRLPARATLRQVLPAGGALTPVDGAGNARLDLPAQSVRVYAVE
jgi:alpha-amylase